VVSPEPALPLPSPATPPPAAPPGRLAALPPHAAANKTGDIQIRSVFLCIDALVELKERVTPWLCISSRAA
jgi:hypothetical protein